MITQETIDKQIQRAQEEISLAEKCIADLTQRKQELQEFIDSLNAMEAEQEGRKEGQKYWYVTSRGDVRMTNDDGFQADDDSYKAGNYYLTEADAIRAEKQIRLFRLLDRFSRQNGWTDEIWQDPTTVKHYIYIDNSDKTIEINSVRISRDACQVYFTSESVARQAIKKYHDLIMEVMAI